MGGAGGVGCSRPISPKGSQSANQPVSKLISQPATQTAETSAVWTGGVWPDSFSFAPEELLCVDLLNCLTIIIVMKHHNPRHYHTSMKVGALCIALSERNINKRSLETRTSPHLITTHNQNHNSMSTDCDCGMKSTIFQMFVTVFTSLSQSLLHSLSKLSLFICENKYPLWHTHTLTDRDTHIHIQPPGCRGNHNAAAVVQAELLRLIRLIVEFHRMGPSLPWN